jgi:UDP-N-acetylmuramyl tripeptide synthase
MMTPIGEIRLNLKLVGESNVYNALASTGVGFALKIDPQHKYLWWP